MLGVDKAHHIAVLQHHPLGLPGGAGGVNNIGQMVWLKPPLAGIRVVVRLPGKRVAPGVIIQQENGDSVYRQFVL
ncbi:hypothetical protein Xsze_03728 [Xenorhabdus szentirmaii DSM 16338]|nr:hypothetical protein Xsze_03728 [Xenorhabdus szentirmaii DSM 16338]